MELMTGIEPVTSSLPRKCSTTELHEQWSGKRGSNSRHSAWKADALPTELFPLLINLKNGGERRIRTSVGFAGRFTVCSLWPLGYLPATIFINNCTLFFTYGATRGIRTPDQRFTKPLLYP